MPTSRLCPGRHNRQTFAKLADKQQAARAFLSSNDPKQLEVNQFAARFLIQTAMLEGEVRVPFSDDDVTGLAKTFDVSKEAITIRADEARR